MNAFWPWQKQNSDFHFLAFPIGYVGGLRWQWGLKNNFKKFLKVIFVQEGSNGTRFDHGQFEIKTFPYTPRRSAHSLHDLRRMRASHPCVCELRTFKKFFTAPWLKNLVEYSYLLPKYSVKILQGKKWAFSFYFPFCKRGTLHVSLWRVAL